MKLVRRRDKGHRMLLRGHQGDNRAHQRGLQGNWAQTSQRSCEQLTTHPWGNTIEVLYFLSHFSTKIRFIFNRLQVGSSVSILACFQKRCSRNAAPAGMPQGRFPGFSLKRRQDVYEDAEVCREDYLFSWQFCREYSSPFPLCPSLNSHPFVCHGVYLYIMNLHQG